MCLVRYETEHTSKHKGWSRCIKLWMWLLPVLTSNIFTTADCNLNPVPQVCHRTSCPDPWVTCCAEFSLVWFVQSSGNSPDWWVPHLQEFFRKASRTNCVHLYSCSNTIAAALSTALFITERHPAELCSTQLNYASLKRDQTSQVWI